MLAIFSLVWFGFRREGCVCSIGSIQNVVLAIFDPGYAVSFSVVAFFALPLVFTLFFGRTFCAAVCPLGAVLMATSGGSFLLCRSDPFVALFRLGGTLNMLVIGGCFLLVGLFVGRPYCRYLCPYGAVLGLLSKVSKWHVKIPPEECINCRLCEDSCPYGAIREPTVGQSHAERARSRRRLVLLVLLVPVLVMLGGWLGRSLAFPLARLDHTVRLAEQVRLEETDWEIEPTDASKAFYESGRPVEELYVEAMGRHKAFASAGGWLGLWVGLVVGVKLLHLSIRRRRVDYQPDRSGCVSCGRCFWYCPGEQARLGLIQDVSP